MKKNEGNADRTVRLILAIVLAVVAYYMPGGAWQVIFYVLAAILLITSATGFCLLYQLMGINTCKVKPVEPVASQGQNPGQSSGQGQN